MSAEEIRRIAVQKLEDARDNVMGHHVNLRYTAPIPTANGVIPASTMEDIAMRAIETNAEVRAYTNAIQFVKEAFKQVTSPKQEPDKPAEGQY